jgi:hypothetical protein
MKLAKNNNAEVMRKAVTHFTEELGEKIILTAMDCPSLVNIAAQCGVPFRTLRYWLTEGRNNDPRFEYFAAEFDRVRSKHEKRWLDNIEEVACSDEPKMAGAKVRANEFLLKTHFPSQYSSQLFVTTMIERQADGFDLSALPTDVLREFLKTLKAIRASNEGAGEEEVKRLLSKINIGKTASESDGNASE